MSLFNVQLFNPYRPFYGIKANRIGPDVMPQKKNAAYHLGLFCLVTGILSKKNEKKKITPDAPRNSNVHP